MAIALLDQVNTLKDATGLETVRLNASEPGAIKLYEKIGFEVLNEGVFMEKN